jgi:uncharacterized damage-inducible protein DinB
MTKSYFIELSDYHIWANDLVCNWLDEISEQQWKQVVVSSFNSIYETILHIASAEKLWIERLRKMSKFEILTKIFNGSKEDLIRLWKQIFHSLKDLIEEMPEDLFEQKLLYKNTQGVEYNLPYYQLLAHLINHTTYHRGQVVNMLRQVGFTDVKSTDMTTYFRIKNQLSI